jgi:hypothetical protein
MDDDGNEYPDNSAYGRRTDSYCKKHNCHQSNTAWRGNIPNPEEHYVCDDCILTDCSD